MLEAHCGPGEADGARDVCAAALAPALAARMWPAGLIGDLSPQRPLLLSAHGVFAALALHAARLEPARPPVEVCLVVQCPRSHRTKSYGLTGTLRGCRKSADNRDAASGLRPDAMEKPSDSPASAIDAAMGVLDRHLEALNAGDAAAVAATLHFPHYRLAGVKMQVWESPENYLADFHARAGNGWHHSEWDFREAFASSADKVHFDVRFTRYRADASVLGCYRSLWIVSCIDGRWAAQLRSSFAA